MNEEYNLFVQVLQNDLQNSIRWNDAIPLVNGCMVFLLKHPVSHVSSHSRPFPEKE